MAKRTSARLTSRCMLLCIAPMLLFAACDHARSPERWIDGGTARRIDNVFATYAHRGSPGFALGLIHDGRLVFSRGYGDANLDNRIPITSHTSFHLASVSKQFTAAAVALLVLDGKLSMEDPVALYIPEARKYPSELRVRDLVYMTSGLHEYFDTPREGGIPWYSAYYFTTDVAIGAGLAPNRLLFKPGTRYDYSNTNFMLLTKIVERVSGQPFSAFMHKRIFAPLEMNDTEINDDSTAVIPDRAVGYAPRDRRTIAELRRVGIFAKTGPGWIMLARNSPHFGGSGVFSNLVDLAKWDANLVFGPSGRTGVYQDNDSPAEIQVWRDGRHGPRVPLPLRRTDHKLQRLRYRYIDLHRAVPKGTIHNRLPIERSAWRRRGKGRSGPCDSAPVRANPGEIG